MKCQICGEDSERVCRGKLRAYEDGGGAFFMGSPNPYPGPIPRGEGRGWVVVFAPARRFYTDGPGRLVAVAMEVAPCGVKRYSVATCGSPRCMATAERSGAPGQRYTTGVFLIDQWLEKNPAP